MWETWVQSLGWGIPWRRERLPTPVFWPGEFHGLYSESFSQVLLFVSFFSIEVCLVYNVVNNWFYIYMPLHIYIHIYSVIYIYVCVYTSPWAASLSRVWLFATPWTIAFQAPLSMEFSRQEYWSELPCPPPGDLPNPGVEPRSLALRVILYYLSHQGNPRIYILTCLYNWITIYIYIYIYI